MGNGANGATRHVYVVDDDPTMSKLSSREHEVLNAVASGLVTKEIASRLSISPRTVDVHRSRIMHKFGYRVTTAVGAYLCNPGKQRAKNLKPTAWH